VSNPANAPSGVRVSNLVRLCAPRRHQLEQPAVHRDAELAQQTDRQPATPRLHGAQFSVTMPPWASEESACTALAGVCHVREAAA
jgi:hypothetical protein